MMYWVILHYRVNNINYYLRICKHLRNFNIFYYPYRR